MNYELFEEKCNTPRTDADRKDEVLELTLDELNYIAGGYRKTDYTA